MHLPALSQRFQRYDSGIYLIPRVGTNPGLKFANAFGVFQTASLLGFVPGFFERSLRQ